MSRTESIAYVHREIRTRSRWLCVNKTHWRRVQAALRIARRLNLDPRSLPPL